MKLEAAGFIVYRKNEQVLEYLLLEASYKKGLWTPPKGHVDKGEDKFETAFRETLEETGLKASDLKLHKEFCRVLNYSVMPTSFNLGRSDKSVSYWLVYLLNPTKAITLSQEHTDYKWLNLGDAQRLAKFKDMQQLLQEANEYINKLCSV